MNVKILIDARKELKTEFNQPEIKIIENEFNLLTNDINSFRPITFVDTFQVPYNENKEVLESITTDSFCEIFANEILVFSGKIDGFSINEQKNQLLVNIVTIGKDLIDSLGDNVYYMDKGAEFSIPIVVQSPDSLNNTDLIKFGKYHPMDSTTGSLNESQDIYDDYLRPSINIVEYFKQVCSSLGWSANWDFFNNQKNGVNANDIVKLPTTDYFVSNWGFNISNQNITVPAQGSFKIDLNASNLTYEVDNSLEFNGGKVQIRQPSRDFKIKLKCEFETDSPFDFVVITDTETLLERNVDYGDDKVRYYSDYINISEGVDPFELIVVNNSFQDININIKDLEIRNLFSVIETEGYSQLDPIGNYYFLSDNNEDVTVIDLLKDFLVLTQTAFTIDVSTNNLDFYSLNDVFSGFYGISGIDEYVVYNSFESIGDKIDGLARSNSIQYKDDTKKKRFFKVNSISLPSNGVYYESIYDSPINNNPWGNVSSVPNLVVFDNNKLKYEEIGMMIGVYNSTNNNIESKGVDVNNMVSNYWDNLINFLNDRDGKSPYVFSLRLSLPLLKYRKIIKQRFLFQYKGKDSILIDGSYNLKTNIFTGVFIRK